MQRWGKVTLPASRSMRGDALIVAAAATAGCRYLLTEDLQDGQTIAGIQTLNPFRHALDEVSRRDKIT